MGFTDETVSMPSRAYTSFLLQKGEDSKPKHSEGCQCPLGLIPHFYAIIANTVNPMTAVCQCPLGLIPHFYWSWPVQSSCSNLRVNALSGLYLISTNWEVLNLPTPTGVSMPSRAYTSFLRYPFKNLGFMRFPEPVFAGIYQNILTTAVFHAC